jgi:hypothetical protein
MPTGRSAVTPIVTDTLRQAGLPNAAIQGILYNVGRESSFNPSMRHADQPRYGGEPHYAHGLYQEGGGEWNQYSRWLAGRDWRDPKLQTQFLAANLKTNYPQLWTQLRTARSPEEAAAAFATGYLKPARPYLIQRLNDIRRGGVTASATQPAAPPRTVPDLVRRTPPADPWMADAWMQPSQGVPFTQSGDPSTFGGPGYAGMTPSA